MDVIPMTTISIIDFSVVDLDEVMTLALSKLKDEENKELLIKLTMDNIMPLRLVSLNSMRTYAIIQADPNKPIQEPVMIVTFRWHVIKDNSINLKMKIEMDGRDSCMSDLLISKNKLECEETKNSIVSKFISLIILTLESNKLHDNVQFSQY